MKPGKNQAIFNIKHSGKKACQVVHSVIQGVDPLEGLEKKQTLVLWRI